MSWFGITISVLTITVTKVLPKCSAAHLFCARDGGDTTSAKQLYSMVGKIMSSVPWLQVWALSSTGCVTLSKP